MSSCNIQNNRALTLTYYLMISFSYLCSSEFLQSLSQFLQSFREYPFLLFVNSIFEKQKCFWLLNVLLKIQLFTFNFQWSFLPTNSVRMCLSIKQSLLTSKNTYFNKCMFEMYQLICKKESLSNLCFLFLCSTIMIYFHRALMFIFDDLKGR